MYIYKSFFLLFLFLYYLHLLVLYYYYILAKVKYLVKKRCDGVIFVGKFGQSFQSLILRIIRSIPQRHLAKKKKKLFR